MTIQEMHNSVMQGVDKINAQVADILLPVEIDLELNKAIQQFVTTRFQQNNKHRQGFEESQKRRDDLRTLVVEFEEVAVFKETIRPLTHASGGLFVDTWRLPRDYMHLINLNAKIVRKEDCTNLRYTLKDQDALFYWTLPFKEFFANNGTTYLDEVWMVNDIELDWGGDGWIGSLVWTNNDFQNVTYPNSQNEIIEAIEDTTPLAPMFWETWDVGNVVDEAGELDNLGIFNEPNSFILPLNVDDAGFDDIFGEELEPNTDPALGSVTYLVGRFNNESVQFSPVKELVDTTLRRVASTTDIAKEIYSCRLVQHDDVFKLIDDPFNKTKYSSPLTVMRGTVVDIYTDDLFVCDTVRMTYLRRPAQVSLTDAINCDLPIATHEEVCKIAVLGILEEISDPRYNTYLSQVDKME